jgi:hypothetical protein
MQQKIPGVPLWEAGNLCTCKQVIGLSVHDCFIWSSVVYFRTTQNANCKIDTSGQQTNIPVSRHFTGLCKSVHPWGRVCEIQSIKEINTPAARSMKHNTGIQRHQRTCPLPAQFCETLSYLTLKLPVTLPLVYVRFDMSSFDHGVISDLLLVLVDVESRLDSGGSLVDLLGTRIFCSTAQIELATSMPTFNLHVSVAASLAWLDVQWQQH